MLTVDARQIQVYALAVRVCGSVGGQRDAGTSALLELQAALGPLTTGVSFKSSTVMVTETVSVSPLGSVAVTVTLVLLPAFVVQLDLCAQLTGGLDDLELVGC